MSWKRLATAALARPLAVRAAEPTAADAIVVLGASASGGRLNAACDERVRAGVDLWRRGLAPLVVMTGRGEAAPMRERALGLGVPSDAVIAESTSRNTYENALRSAELLAARGARSVWVVSQPFHLRRAVFWFRRAGLEPLAYSDPESIQHHRPDLALRWAAREYAAWLKTAWWELRTRV